MTYPEALRELEATTLQLEQMRHQVAATIIVDGALAARLVGRALDAYKAIRAAHTRLATSRATPSALLMRCSWAIRPTWRFRHGSSRSKPR